MTPTGAGNYSFYNTFYNSKLKTTITGELILEDGLGFYKGKRVIVVDKYNPDRCHTMIVSARRKLLYDYHRGPFEESRFFTGYDDSSTLRREGAPLQLTIGALSRHEMDSEVVDYLGFIKRFDYHVEMQYYFRQSKALLNAGANPELLDTLGYSPLTSLTQRAAGPKKFPYCAELFEYLLNTAKVDPDGNASGRRTPLYITAGSGNPRCVQMLLDAGADPNGKTVGRFTPLYAAASWGDPGKGVEIVPLLLGAGADPNAFSTGKNTPLYSAIRAGQYDSITGLFYERTSKYREDPFVEDRFTVIKTLLHNNADADASAVGKETPLYAAAGGSEADRPVVSLLLEKGADPDAKAQGNQTPLYAAAANSESDPGVVSLLLEKGADPDAKAQGNQTPLYAAAANSESDPGVVSLLLEKGADPDAKAQGNQTPLYAAAANSESDPGVVSLLLEKGADPDAKAQGNQTPLYAAAANSESDPGVVSLLLEKGADPDAKAQGNQTPLYAAAANSESDRGVVSLLLENGADPDANAQGKETPLLHILDHILKEKDNMLICKRNAKKGLFDFTDKTDEKQKADEAKQKFRDLIDWAIDQVINPLAEYGADPEANTEQEEETPRYIAKKIGDEELNRCLDEMRTQFKNDKSLLKNKGEESVDPYQASASRFPKLNFQTKRTSNNKTYYQLKT